VGGSGGGIAQEADGSHDFLVAGVVPTGDHQLDRPAKTARLHGQGGQLGSGLTQLVDVGLTGGHQALIPAGQGHAGPPDGAEVDDDGVRFGAHAGSSQECSATQLMPRRAK
jgi:hypothetical protein